MSSTKSKILYLAKSGGGKSTSTRNLDYKRTGYINIDRKELPIYGWVDRYKTFPLENGPAQPMVITDVYDFNKSNYIEPLNARSILPIMKVWEKRDDIDTIVLDTITRMVLMDYMDNAIGKEFKDYMKMGSNFYKIMEFILESNKNYIVYGHTDDKFNDQGQRTIDISVSGNMIQKMIPAGFFTTVLMGYVKRENNQTVGYVHTQSEGADLAKSPAHIDENGIVKTALDFKEPNDMKVILEKLEAFRRGV